MKIVTFNLRCQWLGDGINSFVHRAGLILDRIDREAPDCICFQEGTEKNYDFLSRHLPEYDLVFHSRQADFKGEGLMIAVRKGVAQILDLNCFWLSPTPYVPESRYPGQGDSPRILFWATVRRLVDGRQFRLYDIHLEFRHEEIRVIQLSQALEQMKKDMEIMPLPCFLMGDFNARKDSDTYKTATEGLFPLVNMIPDIPVTYHDFGKDLSRKQIDFIFSDAATAALPHSHTVWTDCENGIYLSDHYPVCLEIGL